MTFKYLKYIDGRFGRFDIYEEVKGGVLILEYCNIIIKFKNIKNTKDILLQLLNN